MGFSVVSIIELFYFMSFRPYCARKRTDDGNQVQEVTNENNNIEMIQKKKIASRFSKVFTLHTETQKHVGKSSDKAKYPFLE